MFQQVFEGKDFCYSYDKKTGHYKLSSKQYKVSFTLKDDDALFFNNHIKHIRSSHIDTINAKIEKAISIHLFFNIAAAINGDAIIK